MNKFGWEEDVDDFVSQSQYLHIDERYTDVKHYFDELATELYDPLEKKIDLHYVNYLMNKIAGEMDLEIPTFRLPNLSRMI